MHISVILCTYNRCESLQKVLNDLKNLRVPEGILYEILVIDNNSSDGTRFVVEAVSAEMPEIFKYIFEPRQGKSFALNRGISVAQGKIIAFTDDDVEIDPEWLVEIKRAFEVHDCVGIGGRIVATWKFAKPSWYEENGPYKLLTVIVKLDLGEDPCELRVPPPGANMAFRRSAFEKYGQFRDDLGPNPGDLVRGEDAEFCWRLIRGGERIMYAPKALVYHPVEEKRIKKEYFESWYFDQGRASVRMEGIPGGATLYFGIPRYYFRNFVAILVKWACCLSRKRRFYYKLRLYQVAGQIAETYTLRSDLFSRERL